MAENIAKRVMITDTILRDAHQSQAATRMRIEEMLPVLEQLDEIGYYSLEAWGGATFDTCLRFLNEDPWERLRILKKHLKKTPIQMLLRGQNLLGYRHYADDVVEKFVAKSIENGVGIVRVFDALNDIRNVVDTAEAVNECGGHFEGAISYTISPVHTLDSYLEYAQQLKELGFFYCSGKKAWAWTDLPAAKNRHRLTLDEIRRLHGSEIIKDEEAQRRIRAAV